MDLYIYIDSSNLADITDDVSTAIEDWVNESAKKAVFVNQAPNDENISAKEHPEGQLGINIEIAKGKELKEPLNFLYGLGKKHKCDFVLGILDSKTKETEDICFFGKEEGKPDVYEISSYIGVKF